jgi:hypothetical protein
MEETDANLARNYDVPVDGKLVTTEQLNFRAMMQRAIKEEPTAVPKKNAKLYAAVMAAPLNTKRNAAQLRRAERKARAYLNKVSGRKIGNWTSDRDWNTFFANLIAMLKELIPLFSTCAV